jgi:hypothetical protein
MKPQEIFDLCSQKKINYIFVEAWIKIVDDSGCLIIEDVEWALTKLNDYNNEDLINEIKEIGLSGMDLEEGYYLLSCLFSVHWDSDDYRSWTYLEPEIIEFDFQISLESARKQQEEFEALNLIPDTISDLFEPYIPSNNYIGLVREEFSETNEWKIGYNLSPDNLDKMKEWKSEMLSCSNIEDCKIFKIEEIK